MNQLTIADCPFKMEEKKIPKFYLSETDLGWLKSIIEKELKQNEPNPFGSRDENYDDYLLSLAARLGITIKTP